MVEIALKDLRPSKIKWLLTATYCFYWIFVHSLWIYNGYCIVLSIESIYRTLFSSTTQIGNWKLSIYIYHWRILWSSYRKLAWVGFEPMTTEFRSDALTDWAIRPWVQLALRVLHNNNNKRQKNKVCFANFYILIRERRSPKCLQFIYYNYCYNSTSRKFYKKNNYWSIEQRKNSSAGETLKSAYKSRGSFRNLKSDCSKIYLMQRCT